MTENKSGHFLDQIKNGKNVPIQFNSFTLHKSCTLLLLQYSEHNVFGNIFQGNLH